mgnify:CR=1 FL=1
MRVIITSSKYEKVQVSYIVNEVSSFREAIEEIERKGLKIQNPINVKGEPDLPRTEV